MLGCENEPADDDENTRLPVLDNIESTDRSEVDNSETDRFEMEDSETDRSEGDGGQLP